MNAFKFAALAVTGLPLVFACGDDNLTLPSEGQPARIEIVSGSGQQGPVNSELGEQLVVKVTDSQGRPVPGAAVEFVVQEDRGGGMVTPETATTNGDGRAAATIHLGTQVGALTGEAQLPADEGETPVAVGFTATAFATGANTISMVSGDGQSGPVGSTLSDPLIVKVTDGFGNPIPDVTVHWSAEGQGTISDETTLTGENGETSVTRTLGPNSGQQTTVASAEGLAGSPVTFTHTATAGDASTVSIVSGNNQEAPAGSQLPQPLVVRVLDADGNPIVDRPVSWVVGDGGGTANPTTSNTNTEGQASTSWTLGSAPGNNTLNAVVSGVGAPQRFTATGTGTGSPSNLGIVTQPPTSVTVGATLTPAPVVQVRDAAGHDLAVPGVEVTVSVSSGRGQLEGTRTVATDASGRATFGDLRITGASGSHKLIFAADGYRSVTSNKIEVEKASTTTAITSDDPDPSDPNQPVTVMFTVSSPAGTPTGNVQVTASDGNEKCTAPVAQGSCQITLTGTGDRTLTASYQGSDVFASSSASAPHHVNEPPPPPVNNPPVAEADAYGTPAGTVLNVPAPGVLGNDNDPDGNQISAALVDMPAGLVTLNADGSFTYFPGLLMAGSTDQFTYDVSDGSLTARATVTITVQ